VGERLVLTRGRLRYIRPSPRSSTLAAQWSSAIPTVLTRGEPAIVLVDEIDLHLHPKWQRQLIGFLTERFPNTQFIVTAHSPAQPLCIAVADEHLEVLTLPVTAVMSEQAKNYCVSIVAGKAACRLIQVGLSNGTRTGIISGLDGRETVVKANVASLVDGQPVKIVNAANPSPSIVRP
jgi:AAA domain, putative AbiEii toxin, Type IV TA system